MGKGYTELPPILPSAALGREYGRKLRQMVKDMHKSILYWIIAEYKKLPELAQDAEFKPNTRGGRKQKNRIRQAPDNLDERVNELFERWEKKWDAFAQEIAWKYANATDGQARRVIDKAFRDHGFTVNQVLTPELQAVMKSSVSEQVSLIKSIPREYHAQVEQLVQRYFRDNRNVRDLSKELRRRYDITSRRAYLIAIDQTAKMNDTISRTRCMSVGITEGIWMHRAGGSKSFRQTHVQMNGKRFKLSEGLYDSAEGRKVHPGECPFCKCVYKPILPFEMSK